MSIFPQTLYYIASDGFSKDHWPIWGAVKQIGTQDPAVFQFTTPNRPALQTFGGSIYCMYRGGYGYNSLCYSTYSMPQDQWSNEWTIPNQTTLSGPALFKCTIDNRDYLYCVYVGIHGDNNLWWTRTADGTHWDAAKRFPNNCATNFEPAAAVALTRSTGENVPLCAFTATDGTLKYSQFVSGSWTSPTPFEYSQSSSAGPSMCAVTEANGDYLPICAYRDKNASALWTTKWWSPKFNTGWKQPILMNRDNASNDGPSISGSSGDKIAFRGRKTSSSDNTALYYADQSGADWRTATAIPNAASKVGPALWAYYANNYLCVFRGVDQ